MNNFPIGVLENCRSVDVSRLIVNWEKLSQQLSECDIGEKDGRAWLPVDIEPGRRQAERVKSITLLVLDIEAKAETIDGVKQIAGQEPPEADALLAELALLAWRCIFHTSFSHSLEHPRYRLVFALSRPLTKTELRPLGLQVAAILGLEDCLDTACLEASRLYYFPRCPAARRSLFRHFDTKGEALPVDELLVEAARIEAAIKKKARPGAKGKQTVSVIDAFNQAHDVGAILEQQGYKPSRGKRWLWPGSTSGIPGVRLLPDSDPLRVYSSHGGDPLSDGHGHDAFGVFLILRHEGDLKAAVKDAAHLLGMTARRGAVDDAPKTANGQGEGEAEESDPGEAASAIPNETERPCFCVFDDEVETENEKYRPGVWHFGIKHGKDNTTPTLTQTWICSPLHIKAVTFDAQDNNFGRLLCFTNTNNHSREWAMPMELLKAAGDDLRGELLAMGVSIDPGGHRMLGQYLQARTPEKRMRCALQVGWCGDSFVLPDTVIGAKATEIIFQSGEHGHEEYTKGGTSDGWQRELSALVIGNPLLLLALSASFAGPLLDKCHAEGGGLHFVGDSSTGKTTVIEAACATWGGTNFKRSWRATANGMEGAAALVNDGLLALDEISECDPKEIGAIVYALGNGTGKQRASRTGNARSVTRWRCMVLSSGERSIGTAMAEGGYRAKAGQSVRLLDVPAARAFGAWDDLHGFANGAAFADALKKAAATHYGHAGRAFLEKLTRDTRNFSDFLEQFKALPGFAVNDGEGQDKRAAGRFALLAMAGELATEYGLTGWPEGAALDAAAQSFKAWQSLRGRGNDERRQILEAVSGFIERHGDSRFSDADRSPDPRFPDQTRDRAGWWRDSSIGRVYLFTNEGLRDALKSFDFKRGLDVLQAEGALPAAGAGGERAKPTRIKARGEELIRLYTISAKKLEPVKD